MTQTKDVTDTQAGHHTTTTPPRPNWITSWLMANQVGERPPVGLATPDGRDTWEVLMNRLHDVNVGMIAVIAIVYAVLMYLLVHWLFA